MFFADVDRIKLWLHRTGLCYKVHLLLKFQVQTLYSTVLFLKQIHLSSLSTFKRVQLTLPKDISESFLSCDTQRKHRKIIKWIYFKYWTMNNLVHLKTHCEKCSVLDSILYNLLSYEIQWEILSDISLKMLSLNLPKNKATKPPPDPYRIILIGVSLICISSSTYVCRNLKKFIWSRWLR